ncbi:hypothetical protein TYRP_021116 [Tyrophagus putrescentiae]|nr:hypothetical protein TYRP_021116 [Tyrophagus putrescentiae]
MSGMSTVKGAETTSRLTASRLPIRQLVSRRTYRGLITKRRFLSFRFSTIITLFFFFILFILILIIIARLDAQLCEAPLKLRQRGEEGLLLDGGQLQPWNGGAPLDVVHLDAGLKHPSVAIVDEVGRVDAAQVVAEQLNTGHAHYFHRFHYKLYDTHRNVGQPDVLGALRGVEDHAKALEDAVLGQLHQLPNVVHLGGRKSRPGGDDPVSPHLHHRKQAVEVAPVLLIDSLVLAVRRFLLLLHHFRSAKQVVQADRRGDRCFRIVSSTKWACFALKPSKRRMSRRRTASTMAAMMKRAFMCVKLYWAASTEEKERRNK